ncbi:glycosyltransferase family 2 protein [Halobium salinum]|uniref:Glycosyltransferase family 2 protein n=1 Tax=Halobium salinum TaxID=1364940 RepID=A0ABD5PAK3_9EURY|nr:glycosyltransferase family 2 protein [Halobium salinum]
MVKISVVIPTHNREDVVGHAIDSALNQTMTDIEVVVVDDASTDDTRAVVEAYDDDRLTYVRHDVNRGGSAARNSGIERSTGEYVAFLDSDDEWRADKLSRQIGRLETRSEEWRAAYCGFRSERQSAVVSLVDNLLERETGIEGDTELLYAILLLRFSHGGSSTLVVERSLVDELEGFDPTFSRHQDWEFLVRLLQRSRLAYVDAPLVTKHDTGVPDFETCLEARKRYLRKFSDIVVDLSLAGYPVIERHRFSLAKVAFANGRHREGIALLRGSAAPHVRDYFGLGLAVYNGLNG